MVHTRAFRIAGAALACFCAALVYWQSPLRSGVATSGEVNPDNFDLSVDLDVTQDVSKLKAAPLSAIPFVMRARYEFTNGNSAAAVPVLQRALDRDPRSAAAWRLQLSIALERRDFDAAFAALSALVAVDPGAVPAYVDVVAEIASQSDESDRVKEFLKDRESFSVKLSKALWSLDERSLAVEVARLPTSDDGRRFILERLVEEENYEAALSTWINFLPGDVPEQLIFPIDSNFSDANMPPPFGWKLNSTYARRLSQGGLDLRYFGRGRPVMARQILPLAPGDYELSIDADVRLKERGGLFFAELECLSDTRATRIGRTLLNKSGRREVYSLDFRVPETDCAYQRINIGGLHGEFTYAANALVGSIGIELLDSRSSRSTQNDRDASGRGEDAEPTTPGDRIETEGTLSFDADE